MTKKLVMPVLAFACAVAPAAPALAVRDRDGDRLPDRWERRYHLSVTKKSGKGDPDRDKLSNRREHRLRTNPRRRDTDRDGLRDGAEVRRYKTNPRKRDTDGDGYSDRREIRAGSDPRDPRSVPRGSASPPDSPPAAPGPSGPEGVGAPATPPPPPRCDLNASPGSLASALNAAAAGQIICLASGDYGTISGAAKPGTVWVWAAAGATPTARLELSGAANIEFNGLTVRGGSLSGGTNNVTIRNSTFTSHLRIAGLANANVLLDHNTHANINSPGQSESPARIHLSYDSATPSGVTVQYSLLAGGDSDGIQSGVGLNIVNNEFRDINQNGPNHTDAIQLLGARGAVIRGNYIHRSSTGIVAYDGLAGALIEDNVIDLPERPWGIELYSDDGSIVRHNTLAYGSCDYNLPCGQIDLNRKSSDDAGRGTVVVDNVATQISLQGGSSAAVRHHNLLRRGAAPGDIVGIPVFVGGASPTSWAGFRLAPGSPGKGAASDGADIGRRG
jgi:hypothetical protein